MAELHLYDNDCDWVIAESPEHATQLYAEFCGPGSPTLDEHAWDEAPPDKVFEVWLDDSGRPTEKGSGTLTPHAAEEWCRLLGAGYVGSTEQ